MVLKDWVGLFSVSRRIRAQDHRVHWLSVYADSAGSRSVYVFPTPFFCKGSVRSSVRRLTHVEGRCISCRSAGAVGVKLGDKKIVLTSGDRLMAPKGVSHAYVTIGTEDAHLLFLFDPAGDMEGHFAALSHMKRLADGRADPEERAKAFAEHGMRMVGPPPQATEFSWSKKAAL